MQAFEFLRGTAKGHKPVYAVYGDDPYLRHEAVGKIVHQELDGDPGDLSIARFAGDQASLAQVFDELRTLPFLARRRVVIVEDADKFITAHRRELEAYVDHPAESGVLVLCPRSWTSTTKLAKLIAAQGVPVECKNPKEAELTAWLIKVTTERFEARLEPDAAHLLVELIGPEVGLLVSEVEKLATYVGERATIERDDVLRMVGAGRVETIWRVLDHATTGKAAKALDLLDRLMTSGEHPVGLLAAMSVSLRKVHHAGQLRRAKQPINEACREAGIPPFAVELTGRQHVHLGPRRVDQLPSLLLETDLALKGASPLPPRVVIERFLLELARPRVD